MKVLLTQHIKKIGKKGDIVDVADGFAVNSLFPQKKAVQATPKIINDHKMKNKAQVLKEKKEKEETLAKLKSLEGKTIEIKDKLNSKNSLYHSVGSKEIIRAIHDQYKINIDNTLFTKKYSLKDAGSHAIQLEGYNLSIDMTLEIKSL